MSIKKVKRPKFIGVVAAPDFFAVDDKGNLWRMISNHPSGENSSITWDKTAKVIAYTDSTKGKK